MSPRAAGRLQSLGFTKVFDYMPGKMDWMAYGLPVEGEEKVPLVAERLDKEWPVCQLSDSTSEAKQRADAIGASFCPVLNEQGVVLGTVEKEHWQASQSTVVEEVINAGPKTIRPSYSVKDAMSLLDNSKQKAVLVTSSEGKLLGVFRRGESGSN